MHVKSSLPKNFTHREQKYFNGVQGSKHKRRLRQRQQHGGVAAVAAERHDKRSTKSWA